ncbi:MAG: family 10 glycosylhydrolase [Dysgonamonadaceae bacterium]|jgi:uncharacterized lipoprotein YddW (UPF0748 family)|nr:family 10 glycosylhydrolase [Dysgonamonadaceae bacterium]
MLLLITAICSLPCLSQLAPKREFRGVWLSVAHQDRYLKMTVPAIKHYFVQMLDELQACRINAVLFQVRPAADAFYCSGIEPWSRYLRGRQGLAPEEDFDPVAFFIEEAHRRNIEFHAWLNPYRVTVSERDTLHASHVYHRHPEWFVKYGRQIYFDPGLPESRNFICEVVKDLVARYDLDAIHLDDYFYPYPIKGLAFPDDGSFHQYAGAQGFRPDQRDDWRRENVNRLIRQIKQTVVQEKPYVRFGVSPFGIYRNRKSTPDGTGSNTSGLQNYDDLYADVKQWVEKEWIDYNIPQIYWETGHRAADYETLINWWNRNNYGAHLYIGQDIARTVNAPDRRHPDRNQLTRKMELSRTLPAVYGNCFWPVYELLNNTGGIADSLKNHYHAYPALIPAYLHLHDKTPREVKSLKAGWTDRGYVLQWKRNGDPADPRKAQYYVVYRFADKEKKDLNDPSKIAAIVRETSCVLPYERGTEKYQYVVTSVDRFHNESRKGKTKRVKL